MKLAPRIFTLLIIVALLLAGLASVGTNITSNNPTPTSGNTNPGVPTVTFPDVPSGGTPVISDYTFFQSSGVFSLPHLEGWDLATPTGEETTGTRAGATFINGKTLSVVHAFVEKDPARKENTVPDLDKYYTKENLDGAWSNFTGGWKELNRRVDGNLFVINFELYLDNNTYLGRQVSQINGDWLVVLRLVAPNNNPQLLDTLQNTVLPKYQFWPQVLTAPITWQAIADYVSGYVIKFPPDWKHVDGSVGHPFTVSGTLGGSSVTLTTSSQPGKSVKTEDDVRAFVKTTWPNATVQTVQAVTSGETTGFAVSYSAPDADGNPQSAVAQLLNGSSTLYIANLQSTAKGQNFLDTANTALPMEVTQIRNSFLLIPTNQLIPTLIPTATSVISTPAP
ncbi:MAG: hypothetical protein ABI947_10940 [Chloroflexota bacterium]